MMSIITNNRGSVMNISLLVLVLLTLIVIFMSRTSTTDVQIASNEKFTTTAFYNADAGAYGFTKVLRKALSLGSNPAAADLPHIDYIVAGPVSFYDQVKFGDVVESDNNMLFGAVRGDEDIEFRIDNWEVNVGVERIGAVESAGDQTDFASGAEGPVGGGAGANILYTARATGAGPKDSRAEINVQYRYKPGVVGGL